jgi:uncharacterized protein (DUF433 family)
MKVQTSQRKRVEELPDYIVADEDAPGGEPVFRGTRVPVVSLFEHLESGCPLYQFPECFPSGSRDAAVAVLMLSGELTLQLARR